MREPTSRRASRLVLAIAVLTTTAFAAQAVGVVDVSFQARPSYVVMANNEVVGNYHDESAASQAAAQAKIADPDAYVGYFGTEFFEAQLPTPEPTATPVPPTATPVPPTATPVPPTATPVPPTATPVPPTATPVPPTATPVPPTATPVPPTATPVPDPDGTLPTRLLGVDDFQYEGSFTVPIGSGGREGSLSYAGRGLAYNPARNSLFMTGHEWHQFTAEISIPELGVQANPADLPRASFVQTPEDATDGSLPNVTQPPEVLYERVGGYLVDGEQLLVSGFDYYDGSNRTVASHLVTDIDFGPSSDMISLTDEVRPRWLGGSMAHIPPRWQASFGGDPWLTGLTGVAIATNASVGPAAATFSPATLDGSDPAQLVLGYPLQDPLDEPQEQSDVWNLTSGVGGMVFPADTATLIYFGNHGTGDYCYGFGVDCNDPVDLGRGNHAYPYRTQIWAYDAADLLAVYNGERTAQSLQPYLVSGFDLPYAQDEPRIQGVAYDPGSDRIFISQARTDGDRPVIHVYTIVG